MKIIDLGSNTFRTLLQEKQPGNAEGLFFKSMEKEAIAFHKCGQKQICMASVIEELSLALNSSSISENS